MYASHPALAFATPPEAWKWCTCCQRCYTRTGGAGPDILSRCPYPDCDGASIVCEYAWDRIRPHNRSFPETPRYGVRYLVYL